MKEGKNFKILGVRQSLIGDCVVSLNVLNWLELKYPNSFKYWHLAKKCSQAADLFLNHPLINQIVITDCEEGFGPKDIELANQCDIVFNTTPLHPLGEYWHSHRNMYEETWIMADIPLTEFHNLDKELQKPKLYKWFDIEKLPKTAILHCFAGYGHKNNRSCSQNWWEYMIVDLIKNDYDVIRLGHSNEPKFYSDAESEECDPCRFKDLRHLGFMDQVKLALGGSFFISSDTGFSLVMGAYNDIPQITLCTNWNIGHFQNFECLAPNNDKNITLFAEGSCSNIPREKILDIIQSF